jgi:hypothetical protein
VKNKYTAPDNFYSDWQTPPSKTKEVHASYHLVLIKNLKDKHDNLINISRKKALTKHENVVVKAFFCDKQKFKHLESEQKSVYKLTCPKSKERLSDAGYNVEKRINQDESALSRDRVRGVYIYGVKRPEN